MTTRTACGILFVLLGLSAATRAQNPPATRPLQDDQRNLDAALIQLNAGVFAEDYDVIRAGLHAENDPKRLLADAQTRRILASIRFVYAVSKFEPAVIRLYEQYHIVIPSDFGMILLGSNWEIRGDRAMIDPDSQFQFKVPPMINVRGVWKLNITPSPPPKSVDALATTINRQAEIIERTTEAIESGKLTTLEVISGALDLAPKFAQSEFKPDLVVSINERPRN